MYFWYINEISTDYLEVLLSTDAGATFKSLTVLHNKTEWSKILIDLGNSNSSQGIIRFKTYSNYGYSDIGIDEIYVGPPYLAPIIATFESSLTSGMVPCNVNFTDQSTGYVTSWQWDFNGDGIIESTLQNPSYTFEQPGCYTVKLIASNTVSSDTLVKPMLICLNSKASLPYIEKFDDDWKNYLATRDVPSFNWVNAPAKAMYSWSRDDDGVTRGAWNSDDAAYTPAGADGSLHSARFHTYDFMDGYLSGFALYVDFSTLAGNKTLSFYYINPGGTDELNVYLSTNGGTSYGDAISTQTISSSWTKVNVDLGNITSSDGIIVFEVSADLDDTDIGIDELSIQTTGITPVSAQFTSDVTSGTVPLTVKFTDQSSGSPTSWDWDFNNDGVVDSTTQNPSYTFITTGSYTVRLISSKSGSTDSESKLNYILVENPVEAQFTADKTSGIGPVTVAFTDQSTGNPTGWSWDFNNDGIIDATVQNPTYTFNSAGVYTVKLTVSKTNSTDTETKISYITVIEPLNADFVADKITGPAPLTVQFTDLSTGGPTNRIWDFDNDGEQDADTPNPSFTYTTSGTYTVKLEISKPGFVDTEIKTGYIVVTTPTDVDPITTAEKDVNVYPNPAHNWVKVKLDNFGSEKIKLEVLGIQGTIISTIDLTGQDSYEIDFSGYARGIYYLKTITPDQVFVNKLVLQ